MHCRAFHEFDADGSGVVNTEELRSVLHKFGMDMPASEVATFIHEVDLDQDGSINFGEFINVSFVLNMRVLCTSESVLICVWCS